MSTGRRLIHDAGVPAGAMIAAAWSPSGDRLVTGHLDGRVRTWDAATGKVIWHKLMSTLISRTGWDAPPSFVTFSSDGQLVLAAGRRDQPIQDVASGVVAIYGAADGRTIREIPERAIWDAALAPDGRMVVIATSDGAFDDTHLVGIEVATGRIRWANPPREQEDGFGSGLVGIHFEAKKPWFEAAVADGDVIRFNALTGHVQRRFIADWRTAEDRKARKPGYRGLGNAVFSADGRTLASSVMDWIHVWDVESGTPRGKIRSPGRWARRLAPGPRRPEPGGLGLPRRRGSRRRRDPPV